ncbi:MAG: hypothetical protein JRF33_03100 [Deltaproteobacteria bacterium]|nr:hypothetical protein [Deltaproteobacteria bacterium]
MMVLLVGAWAATACKCGEDKQIEAEKPKLRAEADFQATLGKLPSVAQAELAAWLPADMDMAIVAARPAAAWAWLEKRPWFVALRQSPLAKDLAFAGPLYRLSTARHRLAALSLVDLQRLSVDELLASPLALGLKKDEQGFGWLLVKQVDLKIQALDRLAEVFNQIEGAERIKLVEAGGQEIRVVDLGEDLKIYYAVFSNLLLVSNTQARLAAALMRPGGSPSDSLSDLPLFKRSLALQPKADVSFLLRPAILGSWGPSAMPGERWLATWTAQDKVRLDWVAEPGPAATASAKLDLKALTRILPADSRMVLARGDVNVQELLTRFVAQAKEEEENEKVKSKPGFELAKLSQALSGQICLAWLGTESQPPLPCMALLVKLKDIKETELAGMLIEFFAMTLGRRPVAEDLPQVGGRRIYLVKGTGLQPAFATVDGWLLLASSAGALKGLLATFVGQQPSLADRKGLATADKAALGWWFADMKPLAADVLALMRDWVGRGKRYNANDVEDGLGSFFEALQGMGAFGGAWRFSDEGLVGVLEPL